MIRTALRWLLLTTVALILADEVLSLTDPWHGTSAQRAGAFTATIVMGVLIVYVLLRAVLFIGTLRLGGGDFKRGRQILAARMAARDARRSAK